MAGALDVIIKLTAQGADSVQGALSGVGRALNGMSDDIQSAQSKTADLRAELERAREGGASMEEIARRTQDLEDHLDSAQGRAGVLQQRLEGIRNAAAGMTAAGVAGMALGNEFIKVAEEGNAVETRLESILKAQQRLNDLDSINDKIGAVAVEGHFDDDDSIRDAAVHMASFSVATKDIAELLPRAARQARTMGIEITSVADGLGKAYADINLAPLKRSAVVFTETEIAAVNAAKGISEAAGRMKFMEVVTAAVDRNTASLGDSLTASQAAANDAARALDDAYTTAGTGAANAKARSDELIASIVGVINTSPGLVEGAGYFGYFGSMALTAGGSVLGVASQIGLLKLACPGLGTAAITAFGAMKTAAATTIPFLLGVAKALAVPFAILVAGVAVGVAGYEALRAANIGGFGDTHKSSAEIFADTKTMMMGDTDAEAQKAADAAVVAESTAAAASNAASAQTLPPTSAGVEAQATAPSVTAATAPAQSNVKRESRTGDTKANDSAQKLLDMLLGDFGGADEKPSRKTREKSARPRGRADVPDDVSPTDTTEREPSIADAFSWLRRGGSIFDLDKANANGAARGSKAVSRETQSLNVPVKSQVSTDAMGDYVIHFTADPVHIPNDFRRAVGGR